MKKFELLNFAAQNFNLVDEEDFGSFQEWEVKEDRTVTVFGTPIAFVIKRGWDIEFRAVDTHEIIFSGSIDEPLGALDPEVA